MNSATASVSAGRAGSWRAPCVVPGGAGHMTPTPGPVVTLFRSIGRAIVPIAAEAISAGRAAATPTYVGRASACSGSGACLDGGGDGASRAKRPRQNSVLIPPPYLHSSAISARLPWLSHYGSVNRQVD